MKKLLFAFLALMIILPALAVEKETFTFSVQDGDTLRLDLYRAQEASAPTPVMIFAFGGGFKAGERDNPKYIPLFDFLADNGVSVVSTDYRTTLAHAGAAAMATPEAFADALTVAIRTAVTDFLTATAFTAAHAKAWNINPAQIFAAGSSAGAITVLQAEYELCNGRAAIPGMEGFNYAGIISMAGAICSMGEPYWPAAPAPMLLFHGDADNMVPFNNATVQGFGLYGSDTISKSLDTMGVAHSFHKVEGADHSVATSPMSTDQGEILDFIRSVVAGRVKMVKTTESIPGQAPYRTDFTLKDYIESNMR